MGKRISNEVSQGETNLKASDENECKKDTRVVNSNECQMQELWKGF